MVVIVLGTPTSMGQSAGSNVQWKAPYSNATIDLDGWHSGRGGVRGASAFNTSSGQGVMNFVAGGYYYGLAVQELALTFANFTANQTRVYSVTVLWRFSYEATLRNVGEVRGTVTAAVNYSSNGSRVPVIGNNTPSAVFVDHSSTTIGAWNASMDRGSFRLHFSVGLVRGMSYYLLTGYLVKLIGGTFSGHRHGGAYFAMGGQGDDHSQLVSISIA
jgi:hypothetical protein